MEAHRSCRQQYSPGIIPLLQVQILQHKDVRREQYSTGVFEITIYRLCRSLLGHHPGNQTAGPVHPDKRDLE